MSVEPQGEEPKTTEPTGTVGEPPSAGSTAASAALALETPTANETPTGPAEPAWKPSYVFLAVVTLVNLVADVATKQWIKHHFETDAIVRAARRIEVIPNYVNLIFATNKGGAWGVLQGEQEALRRPFFLVVSVAAIVFILSLYRKLTPGQRALRWGLPLVLGGALGNLVDRILYGWVIDFIDCYVVVGGTERHWPTFNVADVAICVGVGLMAVDMFTSREKKPRAAAPTGASATGDSVAAPHDGP